MKQNTIKIVISDKPKQTKNNQLVGMSDYCYRIVEKNERIKAKVK